MTTQSSNEPVAQAQQPERDFAWMRVPTQRGMKPAIGPQGLRLRDIDQGSYAYVPDRWPHKTDMPRGAFPSGQTFLEASYSLYDKCDVWSENAADLYEDAIRDRWSSATDIPWDALQPYDEIAERAICQILTEISEASLVGMQIFSGWLERISYGFYEVKSYLATEIYDLGRHHEALRKRALANGGGLGLQSPGIYHRAITSSMRLTELVIAQNLVRGLYHLIVLDALREAANNDADRTLYALVIRDLWRQIDFAVGHVDYYLKSQPEKHDQLHVWLGRAELLLVAEVQRDTPFNEALILLLGGTVDEGRQRLTELRQRFVAAYLHRLHQAGIYNRLDKLAPEIARYAPEGTATPNTALMTPPFPDPVARAATAMPV